MIAAMRLMSRTRTLVVQVPSLLLTAEQVTVTTVGKLFTPAVPSAAEGRLNQLTPCIARQFCSDSGQVISLHRLRSTQPFNFYWWIKSSTGLGKSGRYCLCQVAGISVDLIWHAGSRSSVFASSTNYYTALRLHFLHPCKRHLYIFTVSKQETETCDFYRDFLYLRYLGCSP